MHLQWTMKTPTDSKGKTLKTAREEALRVTVPTGASVVIGRLYPHGSLSQTWVWAVRLQPAALAPVTEELEGGARFVGVEVSTGGANVYSAVTALCAHDASLLGAALAMRLTQEGRIVEATAVRAMMAAYGL